MLTPLEEQTVSLYAAGLTLREVGAQVGRSHEWVRRVVKAHSDTRNRGRIVTENEVATCVFCGRGIDPAQEYCSRGCYAAYRRKRAIDELQPAIAAIRAGKSYQEAADMLGIESGWTLWSRLNHFGLLPKSSNNR